MSLTMPPPRLAEELYDARDAELGDIRDPVQPLPRHVRLFVAGWMLGSVRAAYDLYQAAGNGLLDAPRRLTTADVVAEVLGLST